MNYGNIGEIFAVYNALLKDTFCLLLVQKNLMEYYSAVDVNNMISIFARYFMVSFIATCSSIIGRWSLDVLWSDCSLASTSATLS